VHTRSALSNTAGSALAGLAAKSKISSTSFSKLAITVGSPATAVGLAALRIQPVYATFHSVALESIENMVYD
jgi:hypothetical protein